MLKIYLILVFVLILLGSFVNGDKTKREQAELRARLAKAKSIQDALIILKSTGIQGRNMPPPSLDSIKEEEQSILQVAQELNKDSHPTIKPRNGGCEPRIICEEVPVDRETTNNIVSFPQCLEVYRCGGCCQEPQFPCVPVHEVPLTFSPLLLISLDGGHQYQVNKPLTLMNHTKCECKCNKTEAQCNLEGKQLDSGLCQCVPARCLPECQGHSTCSIVPGINIPRCTCRHKISGEESNYCSKRRERPNANCTRCESAFAG